MDIRQPRKLQYFLKRVFDPSACSVAFDFGTLLRGDADGNGKVITPRIRLPEPHIKNFSQIFALYG